MSEEKLKLKVRKKKKEEKNRKIKDVQSLQIELKKMSPSVVNARRLKDSDPLLLSN